MKNKTRLYGAILLVILLIPFLFFQYRATTIVFGDCFVDGVASCRFLNEKWGIIDKQGKIILGAKLLNVNHCSEEMIVCQFPNEKWGAIDRKGKVVIKPEYIRLNDFSEGMASCQFSSTLWGVIDKRGNIIKEPQYYDIGSFKNGLCPVRDAYGQYKYINLKGDVVIKGPYDYAQDFIGNMAAVQKEKQWGIIDVNGKLLIPYNSVSDITSFSDRGYWYYEKDGKRHYINTKNGSVTILPLKNNFLSEELIFIKKNGKVELIDKDGKVIMPPVFDDYIGFSKDIAAVKLKDKWGFINKQGKFVIPPEYIKVSGFSDGYARVGMGNYWGYIDHAGKIMIKFNGPGLWGK